MIGPPRKLIQGVVKWGLLAAVFVVVLELCARVDDWLAWRAPLWGHYSPALLTVNDEFGIHSRPAAQFEKWKLNAYGFRGPEITEEKPAGVIRVVVIGASETFGLYESPGKEYPAQMQQMLDAARPGRYQVLNAGCAGMTLPRFRHYFGVWIRRFAPDVVIIYPTPASYVADTPPKSEFQVGGAPEKELPESLRLAGKTKILFKRFIPASIQRYVRERQLDRVIRRRGSGWQWSAAPPERPKLFRRYLTELIDTVEKAGVRVVLATHANRFPRDRGAWRVVDRAQMAAWRESYPRASAACLLDMETQGNRVVRELAAPRGIPVADVAAAVPRKPENFADFAHFTDRGARLAARAFVDAVLALERDGKLAVRAH